MRLMLSGLFLSVVSSFVFADSCNNLSGNWEGNWLDQGGRAQAAKLWVGPLMHQQFVGGFMLADSSVGKLAGICSPINEHEAYIKLQEDAPDYNPCRGTIVFYRNEYIVHFYCFNPNQSGYFSKAA